LKASERHLKASERRARTGTAWRAVRGWELLRAGRRDHFDRFHFQLRRGVGVSPPRGGRRDDRDDDFDLMSNPRLLARKLMEPAA
jgi:hypothetical protein